MLLLWPSGMHRVCMGVRMYNNSRVDLTEMSSECGGFSPNIVHVCICSHLLPLYSCLCSVVDAYTRTYVPHTHAYTHARARAHSHTHTRSHAYTVLLVVALAIEGSRTPRGRGVRSPLGTAGV